MALHDITPGIAPRVLQSCSHTFDFDHLYDVTAWYPFDPDCFVHFTEFYENKSPIIVGTLSNSSVDVYLNNIRTLASVSNPFPCHVSYV